MTKLIAPVYVGLALAAIAAVPAQAADNVTYSSVRW
jgi:hypothetical protein